MNRRRTTTLGISTAAAAIMGAVLVPTAEAAPSPEAVTESEWACLALGDIDLGLCADNPLPDLSGLPTLPEILEDLLGQLG